jgi:hypothetical protein
MALQHLKLMLEKRRNNPEELRLQKRALQLLKVEMWGLVREHQENNPELLPLLELLGIPTPVTRPTPEEDAKAFKTLQEEGFVVYRGL